MSAQLPPPTQLEITIQELQDSAPPGHCSSEAFFRWTCSLAERVRRNELDPFEALQAVRWTVIDRMREQQEALDRRLEQLQQLRLSVPTQAKEGGS